MGRRQASRSRPLVECSKGFSFIELLVAMAATVIVMGVVFGLLAQGSSVHTEELERSDLQAQARAALQMLSNDVLMAGGDLPPELPSLRPGSADSGLRRAPMRGAPAADGIEILGNLEDDAGGGGALPVSSFDGTVARIDGDPVRFSRGDLVLVYDDQPTNGKWMFGLVDSVEREPQPQIVLLTYAGQGISDVNPPIALPRNIDSYNRPTPRSGFITPITVIGYGVGNDDGVTDLVRSSLWRQVNWGERVDVAYVEDLEIRYFVGGTVADPIVPPVPAPAGGGGPSIRGQGSKGKDPGQPPPSKKPTKSANGEWEAETPPDPQPDSSQSIRDNGLVRGVRITVTTRSDQQNLRGSTVAKGQGATEDAYLREAFSTRVAPRNILIQAERRKQQLDEATLMGGGPDPRP